MAAPGAARCARPRGLVEYTRKALVVETELKEIENKESQAIDESVDARPWAPAIIKLLQIARGFTVAFSRIALPTSPLAGYRQFTLPP